MGKVGKGIKSFNTHFIHSVFQSSLSPAILFQEINSIVLRLCKQKKAFPGRLAQESALYRESQNSTMYHIIYFFYRFFPVAEASKESNIVIEQYVNFSVRESNGYCGSSWVSSPALEGTTQAHLKMNPLRLSLSLSDCINQWTEADRQQRHWMKNPT